MAGVAAYPRGSGGAAIPLDDADQRQRARAHAHAAPHGDRPVPAGLLPRDGDGERGVSGRCGIAGGTRLVALHARYEEWLRNPANAELVSNVYIWDMRCGRGTSGVAAGSAVRDIRGRQFPGTSKKGAEVRAMARARWNVATDLMDVRCHASRHGASGVSVPAGLEFRAGRRRRQRFSRSFPGRPHAGCPLAPEARPDRVPTWWVSR